MHYSAVGLVLGEVKSLWREENFGVNSKESAKQQQQQNE
jgi:hypothetical protein